MVKRTLKQWLALLLCLVMVGSMLTEAIPPALAAEGDGFSADPTLSDADADYSDDANGRPRLSVDFLGDNMGYNQSTTITPGVIAAPARHDQSKDAGKGGAWEQYTGTHVGTGAERIFWVGVGIDRMNVLDLFRQDDNGLYTAEIGFYYNDTFIEPYVGGGDYKATITAANINHASYPNQWPDEYEIITAETGLAPQTDWVTQENIDRSPVSGVTPVKMNPGMEDIMAADSTWKLTYVALEKKDLAAGNNRFQGLYQADSFDAGNESNNKPKEYILMIPFVLKRYDDTTQNCLRLARSAHLFSLGGGADGTSPYAAWERVTTRNPGRDIKLMTKFTGDLNIFTGKKEPEQSWNARLMVRNGGSTANKATLHITDDPAPNKVSVTANGAMITGLYGGTGLTVDVHCESGYTVKVEAYKQGTKDTAAEEKVTVTRIIEATATQDGDYRLVLPEMDVDVFVTFEIGNATDFNVFLEENVDQVAANTTGNLTTITVSKQDGTVTGSIDSDTVDGDDNPIDYVSTQEKDRVDAVIQTHPDYDALVQVVNSNGDPHLAYSAEVADVTAGAGGTRTLLPNQDAKVLLPGGGTVLVPETPRSDIILRVTYVPAQTYTAQLEVYHDGADPVDPSNVAQLSYLKYDAAGTGTLDYSGVVYHQYDDTNPTNLVEDHSAVESPTGRVLEQIDASAAARSGSLGGDGAGMAAQDWTRLMSYVYTAAARGDLDGKTIPYDWREAVADPSQATPAQVDLRKNAAGAYYRDGDLTDLLDLLWKLHEEIAASTPLTAQYKKDFKDAGGKVLYTYYDLTPNQVQTYVLEWEKYDADKAAYDKAKQEYDDQVAAGDATVIAPVAPTLPALKSAAAADTYMDLVTWPATPVGGTASAVTTRYQRQLVLTLEADSAYQVKEVKLVETLAAGDTTSTPRETVYTATGKDTGYANVWTFPMPEYDCKVQVTYEKRLVHDLSLTITGGGAGVNGNDVELVAFGPAPAPGSVTPQTHRLTASTASPVSVFEGSTVTVTLKKLSGYTLSLSAKSGTGGSATSIVDKNNMNSGDTVTFLMPANVAAVTVTYTPVAKPKHTAYIDADDLIPADSDYRNTALWTNGNRTYPNVEVDTVLTGEIAVAPGYYVHSVRAVTSTGAVGYTLSGNGYNNGLGGDVTVQAAMPDDDLHVYVVFAKGPPPEEPDYNLTLLVDDPDNMGEGSPVTYADNWATVTVDTTQPDNTLASTTSPKVSAHGTDKSYTAYTKGGRLVEVEMHPGDGYYVSDVVVSPGSFGVSVMWKDETRVQFYMPGGDVGVTVNFAKGTKPTYFLDLDKTEIGDTGVSTNIISLVQSATIRDILKKADGYTVDGLPKTVPDRTGSIGAAAAGEEVTLTIDVTAGWYVDGLTITAPDGSTVPYGLSGNGYNATANQKVTATFAMPRGDVSVIVDYVHGAPPADKSYRLDVRVVDPDNAGTGDPLAYVDNKATVKVSHLGAPDVTVGPLGKKTEGTGDMTGWTYAMEGDTVAITWDAVPGYALDYLRVGPAGTTVVPVFTGPTTAVFTMPARQTSVEVHFKQGAAAQYTANLILRVPSGADYTVADAGQGTFTAPPAGTLDAPVYAMTAAPGTAAALGLFANPGYYVKSVTVTPASAEATAQFTGGFASQTGTFVMPQANVYVNVLFEKGWPDEATYDMTLAVTDPWVQADNYAKFVSLNGTDLAEADQKEVLGGKNYTVKEQAKDKDSVFAAIHQAAGYYVDADSITITGSAGTAVSWAFAVENGVSGIRFTMPPEHVLVQVTYQKGVPTDYTVKVYVKDESAVNNTVNWNGTPQPITKGSSYIEVYSGTSAPGTSHTLTVTPGADAKVAAAYAVSTDGDQLILPVTQVASGGTVSFAMPDADADVYVAFADGAVPAGDQVATLTVAGPTGSGTASMSAEVPKADGTLDHTAMTGTVNAGSSAFLTAPEESLTTVAVTPTDPGYLVQSVRIVDESGAEVPFAWVGGSYDATQDPAVWVPATDHKLTFSMPANGAHVLVTLAAEPAGKTFTAQVIVNDSAYTAQNVPSENSALLRKQGGITGAALISGLTAGEGLDLDLNVHPGYMIESVIVVPQSYGIVPGLSLGNLQSQTTGFAMPADDVVVYVKFVKDDLTRYTATLDVTGTPGNAFRGNKATIESAVSGKKGPIATDDAPVSVQAAPGVEWVTVEYDVQADSSVESVTVLNAAGTYVPFTQLPNTVDPVTGKITHGAITFPMVSSNVRVIVNYRNTPDPVTYDAVLHVIDLDAGNPNTASWGSLTYGTDPAGATGPVYPDPTPGSKTIKVPAGETVTVDAFAGTDVYIQAAYVLFQEHGQMINCNFTPDDPGPGFTGNKQDSFIMHPGTNDIYIYFTSEAPATNAFASVLMLTGPTADKDSSAKMFGQHGQVADVQTNGSHGYITATKDETVTVTVTPAEGYAIASILMSPLGIELTPVRTGNTYTFTMPARNVAAHITLKESTAKDYTATLHILDKTGTENVDPSTVADKGVLSLDDGTKTDQAAKQMEITVPEGEGVHIGATPAAGNTILAAYVMKGPSMVPMGETLEGKTAACATSFTMPGGNVDVYLIFTDTPPTGDWFTAVLVVTDDDGKGHTDSGDNRATFESSATNPRDIVTSDGLRTHFYTVRAGEKATVIADTPHAGYEFDAPPTITASSQPNLSLTKVLDSVYTYDIPFYNSAVHVHFKSTETTKRSLNVRVADPDNPGLTGEKAHTNAVEAAPDGMTMLTVESRTTAGGLQTIPGVEQGKAVKVNIKPHSGYYPEAVLTYGSGQDAVTRKLTLKESGGVWTIDPAGSFLMPGENATLTVTFHQKWSATLTLRDSSHNDAANRPYMTEDAFGQKITVDNSWPTKTMESLLNGTKLTTTVPVLAEQSRLVGVLLHVDGSTTVMKGTAVTEDGVTHDEYYHTISRANAEVEVVVESQSDTSYLAAVQVKNQPEGLAAPTISATNQKDHDAIWTRTAAGETVTVSVPTHADYTVDVKAEQLDGTTVVLSPDANGTDWTFTMPDGSVNVTVTYTKTKFTATLHIANPELASKAELKFAPQVANSDGAQLTGLSIGDMLKLTAIPTDAYITGIIVTEQTTGETSYRSDKLSLNAIYSDTYDMPADDVDVTVIFGKKTSEPDAKDLYVAAVTTETTGGEPGNAAQSVQNQTTAGLPPADDMPPDDLRLWAAGYGGDLMLASYTVAPGYVAVVTAKRQDNSAPIPVLQQDVNNAGTAAIVMPQADVLITVTYHKQDHPPTSPHKLTLTLVGHDGEADNQATLTVEGTPNAINMSGKQWTDGGKDKADPATTEPSAFTALLGDPLLLDAGRRSTNPEYEIYRVTAKVKDDSGTVVEQNIPFNSYGTTAAALLYMPDADVEVTVYYRRIYTAALSIVDSTTDKKSTVSMTDDRVGTTPVTTDGGKLTGLVGTEQITTTITEDTATARLVGVLYTSDSKGVRKPTATTPDLAVHPEVTDHDFTMPAEDVTVTAVLEPKDGKSHLAWVEFTDDSAHLEDPANGVDIVNGTKTTASNGPLWTAAEKNDRVDLTFHLAEGYQAEILWVSAEGDRNAVDPDKTDVEIYVNRQIFVTDGKTASFTMPDDNAIVLVRFIQGYRAKLEFKDNPQGVDDKAVMDVTSMASITGTSNGTKITYEWSDGTDTAEQDYVEHVKKDTEVAASGTPKDTGKTVRILKHTAFAGTSNVDPNPFPMPAENTLVSVIMDPNPLIAKVQLKGETDIVGNGADIGNASTPPTDTIHGTIWTTAKEADKIEVSLTVAANYIAVAKVIRDDSLTAAAPVYLTGLASPDGSVNTDTNSVSFVFKNDVGGNIHISDQQTFTFKMPKDETSSGDQAACDVTVIIEFIYAGAIPAPYDPGNHTDGALQEGWIYGENRGGYAVVTVPTLHKDAALSNAHEKDGEAVTYKFFLKDAAGDYVQLDPDTDILVTPADPEAPATKPAAGFPEWRPVGSPYNYGEYYTDTATPSTTYTGVRFNLSLREKDLALQSDAAKQLAAILDNDGTKPDTELFILAESFTQEQSAYTQVVVKPYIGITGTLVSYAPQHQTKLSLYQLKNGVDTSVESDLLNPANYADEPNFVTYLQGDEGTGLWSQEFIIGSSELIPDETKPPIYMLFIEKPGNIPYSHFNLKLDTSTSDYKSDTKTFPIVGDIKLIPGDVSGDWRVDFIDDDYVSSFYYGRKTYTDTTDPNLAENPSSSDWDDWDRSIYNPTTLAYRCDLDGDGNITIADLQLVQDHMRETSADYNVMELDADGKETGNLVKPSDFQTKSLVVLSEELDLMANPEELLPEELPIKPEEPSEIDPGFSVDPEDPVDPDFSVDPEEPVDPVDPDFTVDPPAPDNPADLPPTPTDPILPPEDSETGPGDGETGGGEEETGEAPTEPSSDEILPEESAE